MYSTITEEKFDILGANVVHQSGVSDKFRARFSLSRENTPCIRMKAGPTAIKNSTSDETTY